ncbi:MAG: thiol reductant ABC exporter subunit CydC [Methylococcaceae bacterium]|nr:thiol reductant ABC exporter subunit CydC [Methylococcaceae bacterium]
MNDLLFFLKLFTPYRTWLILGVFLALLTSLASISLLTLSGWFITSSAIAGLLAPDGVAIAFNFMQPAAEIRALAITRTFGRYAERIVTHEATFRVLAEIRCWFFAKLIPLSPGRLSMQRSAELLNGITREIDILDDVYLRLCSPVFVGIVGGGAVIFFLACYSIQISIFVFIMLLISGILVPLMFNRLGQDCAKKIVEQSANFKIGQVEILQGIAELNSFNAYTRYKNKLTGVSEQLLKTQVEQNKLEAYASTIILILSQFTLLACLTLGSNLYQQGKVSGAEFAMLSFCVLVVFELVTPLTSAMQLLPKMQIAANRILRVSGLKPTITEPIKQVSVPKNGDIKITQLSFRYAEDSDWILNDINLTIPYGSKIAIVGSSGAGKTTLLQMIMRFYDPQIGCISYAGIDYKRFFSDKLMARFSVLSQRTQLFTATIKENLLIAKPSASDLEITQAIKLAGLEPYIRRLPNGLNTWVGENGVKVSGGEGRRIALARVYLKNSPILLLDEPTEGLDKETENDVLSALEKIVQNKTLIMVTHRRAGLRLVDNIYRIKNGRII